VALYANESGEVPSRDVLVQGVIEGFTAGELKKARSSMGHRVKTRKVGKDGGWNWYLADPESTADPATAA
jgi:hypothetical protein